MELSAVVVVVVVVMVVMVLMRLQMRSCVLCRMVAPQLALA